MQQVSSRLKADRKRIGFVPTMGYLHDGHLSLVKESKKNSDVTIVSIFVNPAQFAPNEDLEKYPRDFERDKSLLLKEDVDILFYPESKEIYPENFKTYVEVDTITKILEGEVRPSHFKGVTTVVNILFNIVKPDYTFFGQKDAQQSVVIKQMVKDLKMDVKIIVCPVVREEDGLAMSSRNIYLTKEEREKALLLSKTIFEAGDLINLGERDTAKIIKKVNDNFIREKTIQLNYIKIVEAESFKEAEKIKEGEKYFILIAAKVGKTRLIDNILV